MANNFTQDHLIYNFSTDDFPAFAKMAYISPHKPYDWIFLSKLEVVTENKMAFMKSWFKSNWHASIFFSILYIACIFLGRRFMQNRPRFELQTPLICWSLILAIFSIVGSCRVIAEFLYILFNQGFYYSVCYPTIYYGVAGFWSLLFPWSKLIELGDTAFVILRKQPLLFLHWYHHATVLMYCWHSYSVHSSPCRWFSAMNYVVHSVMYSYYALRAAKLPVHRFVNITITTMQICQMAVGAGVCLYAYQQLVNGNFCNVPMNNLVAALLMYLSYFILFINYFYHTYFSRKRCTPKTLERNKKIAIDFAMKNGTDHYDGKHVTMRASGISNGNGVISAEDTQASNGYDKKQA